MPASVYLWNVAHGLAASIFTSNGRWILYDAGRSEDWSAIDYQRGAWNLGRPDLFVLSHAHADHLRDIDALVAAHPRMVLRPTAATTTMLREAKTTVAKSVVEEYEDEIDDKFTLDSDENPFAAGWAGTTSLQQFVPPPDMNPNNESRVLFVDCGGLRLALTGDLERKGWETLLDKPGFAEVLSGTHILVVPHHGRENGVCEDALDLLSPAICLISDGPAQATSTDRYALLADGAVVTDAITGNVRTRYTLTTRSDGNLLCRLYETGELAVFRRICQE
jgi:competence protein ComEC